MDIPIVPAVGARLGGEDDAVDRTLNLLRMSGVVYCHARLHAPWGLWLPPMPGCLMVHVFLHGDGWLLCDGEAPRRFVPGSLALVPHGAGHRMLSDPGATGLPLFELGREPVSRWFERLETGGDGPCAETICAAVRFDDPLARHLAASLPALVAVDDVEAPERTWLRSSVALLGAEASQPRAGSETIITRLADILVVQALRAWIEREGGAGAGWLRGLRDRHVGRALALVHHRWSEPWSLTMLASAAGLSRAAFADRFTRLVGEPPMTYLTGWRMRVAASRLQDEAVPLARLAAEVGYESESSFSRAFRRATGHNPGAYARGAWAQRR